MINPSRLLMLSGMLLAMAACSPAVRQGPPAPIIGPGGSGAPSPASASGGNVTVTPLKAPEITAVEQEPVQTFRRPDSALESTPEPAPASAPRDDEREQVALAKPRSMSKAVKTLVDQAELQRASGDLTGAAATLERGLRIEPESAYVWNRLAHVRAAQGQAGLASELAAKSNALAGGDENLRRDNDRLIARSRK